jgi:hypothetical protein
MRGNYAPHRVSTFAKVKVRVVPMFFLVEPADAVQLIAAQNAES